VLIITYPGRRQEIRVESVEPYLNSLVHGTPLHRTKTDDLIRSFLQPGMVAPYLPNMFGDSLCELQR
jgi:hypothetical protein